MTRRGLPHDMWWGLRPSGRNLIFQSLEAKSQNASGPKQTFDRGEGIHLYGYSDLWATVNGEGLSFFGGLGGDVGGWMGRTCVLLC